MPTNRLIPTLALVAIVAYWQSQARGQTPLSPTPTPAAAATTPAQAPAGAPATATATPEAPPTEAETLIDAAIKKVAALKRVSADIHQRVTMLGQNFELTGQYLKDVDFRIYMKLTVSGLGDSTGTMLQVCDGKTLWDFRQVLESQSYGKLEIVPVMQKLNAPGVDATLRDQIITQLGFAGPETMLSGLRKVIHFDQKEEATLDGKAVYVLRGTWKDREGLTAPNGQPLPAMAPLPAYIPSLATVWVGKDDGWPYQLLLVGRAPSILQQADNRPRDANGRPIGRVIAQPKIDPSRVELTYSNVKLNPDLPPDSFAFQAPPGAPVSDSTQELVSRLDEMIRIQAEQSRQEGAQTPTLGQSLDIPKPEAGAAGFPLARPSGGSVTPNPTPTPGTTPAPSTPPASPR